VTTTSNVPSSHSRLSESGHTVAHPTAGSHKTGAVPIDRPETPAQSALSQAMHSSPAHPNALDSLDKLLQFKASVDATRQSHQTDFEPGQLALVAQTFLQARSGKSTSPPALTIVTSEPEPGEVIESPGQDTDPVSRAAMLKASLMEKKRKPDHTAVQVKAETPSEAPHRSNAIETNHSNKRPRADSNTSQAQFDPQQSSRVGQTGSIRVRNGDRSFSGEDYRPSVANFVPSRFQTASNGYKQRARSPSPRTLGQRRYSDLDTGYRSNVALLR